MSKKLKVSIFKKEYKDIPQVQALGKNNFEVNPGEFVTILGPSGCGKSTLLKLISGIDSDFEGSFTLGERVIKSPEKDCGIVFQEPRLLPWLSIKNNIRFGIHSSNLTSKHEKTITDLLNLLDLKEFTDSYPSQLSGGMAQKVALARALVNIPDLLLLDEPFASLDKVTKSKLHEELFNIVTKEKTTSLMVTHDIEEAIYLSDRILIMSKRPGKIVKSYSVNMPKPRERTSKEFMDLTSKILKYMHDELKLF